MNISPFTGLSFTRPAAPRFAAKAFDPYNMTQAQKAAVKRELGELKQQFFEAIKAGNVAEIQEKLKARDAVQGASLYLGWFHTESKDQDGFSTFDLAAKHGHWDALTFLVRENKKHTGFSDEQNLSTFLQYNPILTSIAVFHGHTQFVKQLLEHGADPDGVHVVHEGNLVYTETPLMLATREQNAEIMQILLKARANPSLIYVKGHNETSALDIANAHGWTEGINLLEKAIKQQARRERLEDSGITADEEAYK